MTDPVRPDSIKIEQDYSANIPQNEEKSHVSSPLINSKPEDFQAKRPSFGDKFDQKRNEIGASVINSLDDLDKKGVARGENLSRFNRLTNGLLSIAKSIIGAPIVLVAGSLGLGLSAAIIVTAGILAPINPTASKNLLSTGTSLGARSLIELGTVPTRIIGSILATSLDTITGKDTLRKAREFAITTSFSVIKTASKSSSLAEKVISSIKPQNNSQTVVSPFNEERKNTQLRNFSLVINAMAFPVILSLGVNQLNNQNSDIVGRQESSFR